VFKNGQSPWSVCMSVTFVHCAQTAEDIDTVPITYESSMSLPEPR